MFIWSLRLHSRRLLMFYIILMNADIRVLVCAVGEYFVSPGEYYLVYESAMTYLCGCSFCRSFAWFPLGCFLHVSLELQIICSDALHSAENLFLWFMHFTSYYMFESFWWSSLMLYIALMLSDVSVLLDLGKRPSMTNSIKEEESFDAVKASIASNKCPLT